MDSPLLHNTARSPNRHAGPGPVPGLDLWRLDLWRHRARHYLASKEKHYAILGLVGLDVVAILAEILVSLVTCERGGSTRDAPWVDGVLTTAKLSGLVISSLFLVELLASVWAFGWGFFAAWFHCFDAMVIVVGFVVDVLAHGVLEDIASLVVVLRLWRMVKMIEELSVGAEEQMEELAARVDELEHAVRVLEQEKRVLEQQLRARR